MASMGLNQHEWGAHLLFARPGSQQPPALLASVRLGIPREKVLQPEPNVVGEPLALRV